MHKCLCVHTIGLEEIYLLKLLLKYVLKNKFRKKYYPMNKSFYYVKKHNLELNFYKNKYYIKFQQS